MAKKAPNVLMTQTQTSIKKSQKNPEALNNLLNKLEAKTATVAVIGLGYVGLPLVHYIAQAGFNVVGIDNNAERVQSLNKGQCHIKDLPSNCIAELISTNRFKAHNDYSCISQVDAAIICVPTPLSKQREPDLSLIQDAVKAMCPYIKAGQLIVLESTTYPGTTDEILSPMLEEAGFTIGQDLFLAFSPERVDPGNSKFTTHNTPKVVGGVTPSCTQAAVALYQPVITGGVVAVKDAKTAEMTKIFENTFRSINIGLVNEMTLLCDRMGINIWEVLDAAFTKPFGIMPFYPGPGVGGHCIPIDPFYLAWKAKEYDFHTRFIELAGDVNRNMPRYVRDKIIEALGKTGKALNGAKVVILGMGYKAGQGDWRESPGIQLLELLEHDKAEVAYCDPYVAEITTPHNQTVKASAFDTKTLSQFDCAVLITAHPDFNLAEMVNALPVLVDTRNACKALQPNPKIVLI